MTTKPVIARQTTGAPPNHFRNTLLFIVGIVLGTALLQVLTFSSEGWSESQNWSDAFSWSVAFVIPLVAIWLGLIAIYRPKYSYGKVRFGPTPPYTSEEYAAVGLGAISDNEDTQQLYIDMVKRCVANILYEDQPVMFNDGSSGPELAREFDLQRRVDAEDVPTQAHTMIGMRRLENIQHCIEDVLKSGVEGDFAETGSFRGGATIFMRAVLKAHTVTDRKVYVCDAFVPPQPQLPPKLLLPFLQALASIPGRKNKRRIFSFLERLPQSHRAFPLCEDPHDDWIDFVLWALRHPETICSGDTTSRSHVESRFARYGLLDEQVVFLEGYFAETLPAAPFEKLAILRLDGDTYESTRDGIEHAYEKLSSGGYCIVDDYNIFDDCKLAITEYREKHGITETIHEIDNMAVYWKKQ